MGHEKQHAELRLHSQFSKPPTLLPPVATGLGITGGGAGPEASSRSGDGSSKQKSSHRRQVSGKFPAIDNKSSEYGSFRHTRKNRPFATTAASSNDGGGTFTSTISPRGLVRRENSLSQPVREAREAPLEVGGCTECGAKQENQDVFDVQRLTSNELYVSVLDGHGAAGGEVAAHGSMMIYSYLNDAVADGDPVTSAISRKQILRSACLHTHRVMCERSTFNTRLSGSTVTLAIVRRTLLTIAWLGDSRAVLGREDRKTGRLRAIHLTRDHNCDDMVEAARIRRCGGKVQQYYYCGRFVGPKRIWLKEPGQRMPGLVVTRSVGDELAHSLGCLADPEMLEIELTSRDRILIVASDGVWDGLSNSRAIEIAAMYHSAAEASRAVVNAALESLQRLGMGDNVTAVVTFLPVPI